MIRGILFICLSVLWANGNAQTYSISGKVENQGIGLPQVTLVLNDSISKVSNAKGEFVFNQLKKGLYTLKVSHVQFEPQTLEFWVNADTLLKHIQLEEKAKALNEVTVLASKSAQLQRDNTLNVTHVSDEYIQRNLQGSLMQSLEKLPGVLAMQIGAAQSKPQIRGLGFNQVLVVTDGVKHEGQQWGADHGLEIDQFAAGSVEILKGAASYRYGSDALGGVIHIQKQNLPKAHTIGGQWNSNYMSNNGSLANSLQLFARRDHWFYDARYTHKDYGDYRVPTERIVVYDYAVEVPNGYIRNSAGKERNVQFNIGRVAEKWTSQIILSNVYNKSGFFANAHGLESRKVNAAVHDASRRDILNPNQSVYHFKIIHRTDIDWADHQLRVDLAYQNNFRQEHSDYIAHGFMPAVYPKNSDIPADLEREFNKHVFSLQVNDTWQKNEHKIHWGANFEHQKNTIGGWGFLIPDFKQSSGGLYVYDQININPKTYIQAALRQDWAQLSIDKYTDWFESTLENGQRLALTRVQALNKHFASTNGALGINYQDQNFIWKANIGTSFRIPIAKELAANGVNYHYFRFEKGNPNLSPEQSIQVDLAWIWKTQNHSIEFTPFYNYFFNYIYLNPTALHDFTYGAGNQIFEYQQSKVMRLGAEIQYHGKVSPKWEIDAALEYLYNEQLSGAKKGYTIPFTPAPSGWASLTFKPLEKTFVSFEMKHTLEQNKIVPPEKITPAYTLFNISAAHRFHLRKLKPQLSLQVNNIFNKAYLNHTSFYRLIELPEMGRNISLSLKVPFVFEF